MHYVCALALLVSAGLAYAADGLAEPIDLRALARDGEVALAWKPVKGAVEYRVKHATTSGGPYKTAAKAVTGTQYVASRLENDSRHYFVVSVTGPEGNGADSAEVSAIPFRLWPRGDEWPYTYRTEVKGQHAFFHLWLPKHTPVVKGLFVFSYHGCGGQFSELAEMRYLAASLDCAVVVLGGETIKRGFKPSRLLFDALADLAGQSEHPEIVHAPIFTFGHSNGTGFSAGFASQEPGRVFGWIAFKSANGRQFSLPPIYRIPGLVLSGERDRSYFNNQLDTVEQLRQEHQALMHMIVEPSAGHGPNRDKSYRICMAFMKTVFHLRVPADADPRRGPVKLLELSPDQGWLGKNWDKTTGGGQRLPTAPRAEFTGDSARASWLPTADYALLWQEFSEKGDLSAWW